MPLVNRVAQLFERKLGLRVPSPDADLLTSGIMDSLTFVNMLLQIEAEFGIKISLDNIDLEKFRSVSSIADFIRSLPAQNEDGPDQARALGSVGGRLANH